MTQNISDRAAFAASDRSWGRRDRIEAHLRGTERDLVGLEETIRLCNLTSTYFEEPLAGNPKARGYSRNGRVDWTQAAAQRLDPDRFKIGDVASAPPGAAEE